MIERYGVAARGKRAGYIPPDTFAALKQPLISGVNPESSPANMSARAAGGRGSGRRTGNRVNAQFVFRSAEKTRSLHAVAGTRRRTRRNSLLVADVRVVVVLVVGFTLTDFIFMTTPSAEKYELRVRCINFRVRIATISDPSFYINSLDFSFLNARLFFLPFITLVIFISRVTSQRFFFVTLTSLIFEIF